MEGKDGQEYEGAKAGQPERKRGWVVPTITTVVGVAVSLVVAWYQITLNEEQALQAEIERSKAVKSQLVQIVEEHIINNKVLNISRLARLAEFRASQEKLLIVPTVSEIVQGAEYNILKSQYLEFDKKQNFKDIFDEIYADLSERTKAEYSGLFENSVNDLYASIQSGSVNDTTSKLNNLLTDFNARIKELEAQKSIRDTKTFEDIIKVVFEKPYVFVALMTMYLAIFYYFMYVRRRMRRRKDIEREVMQEYVRERADLMRRNINDPDDLA